MSEDGASSGELFTGAFLKLRDDKRSEREKTLRRKRSEEARAIEVADGRMHTKLDGRGKAQLNTRIDPYLKNRVVEAARAGGKSMEEIMDEILRSYFREAS
jgi:uncharacterized protein (DUF4415 family)